MVLAVCERTEVEKLECRGRARLFQHALGTPEPNPPAPCSLPPQAFPPRAPSPIFIASITPRAEVLGDSVASPRGTQTEDGMSGGMDGQTEGGTAGRGAPGCPKPLCDGIALSESVASYVPSATACRCPLWGNKHRSDQYPAKRAL